MRKSPDAPEFQADFGARVSMPGWVLSAERSVHVGAAGRRLFSATWHPENRDAPDGTVILFQGRAESAYRWEEPARIFSKVHGQRVITADWPGQGFSGRNAAENAHHYDSLDELAEEGLHLIETLANEGKLVPPVTLLGHSMGGLIAARVAILAEERWPEGSPIDRLVLNAMMSGLHRDLLSSALPEPLRPLLQRGPEPHALLGKLAAATAGLGALMGKDLLSEYAMGARTYLEQVFEQGPTSIEDPRRHERALEIGRRYPSAQVGGPTWGFFKASSEMIEKVRAEASRIRIPTLVISAELDDTVDNQSHERIASMIPGARHVTIAGADHSPQQGPKPQRREFMARVGEFLKCPP